MERQKFMLGVSMEKEIVVPKSEKGFVSLFADGSVKMAGRDPLFRTSTSIHDHLARGEDHNDDLQEV